MKIFSNGESLIATFAPATRVWHSWIKGSHTVNVWEGGHEIDCYTFAWEKNHPSMLDFTTALESYLTEA